MYSDGGCSCKFKSGGIGFWCVSYQNIGLQIFANGKFDILLLLINVVYQEKFYNQFEPFFSRLLVK
jgi:hypothetical protein